MLQHNLLIAGLPARERKVMLGMSEPVDLLFGTILSEANEPLEHAWFPVTCLITLVATTSGHQPLGVAMIGNEGVLGAMLALDVNTARLRGVVHGSGSCLRIPADQLRRALRNNPALVRALKGYSFVLMGQLMRTAVCNSFHEVEVRLARWLLMADDRAGLEPFSLTHQFLADLLGVQRSAVTIAAGKLQRKKLIGYVRGQVNIISRSGLERIACECYQLQIRDHALQFNN
jgi:hypothetical protein